MIPLPAKIVDISMALDDEIVVDPAPMRPKISMMEHGDNLDRLQRNYPGLDPADLPGGLYSAYETITLATHNGTHVDAPKHYHPVDRNGDPMPGIDEMPLDWFMRPGVKFDFRHFDDGSLGIVCGQNPDWPLQPHIVMLRNGGGRPIDPWPVLDGPCIGLLCRHLQVGNRRCRQNRTGTTASTWWSWARALVA